jgi:cytosine/adenosine deaminase-related metal-dependent hydrolase
MIILKDAFVITFNQNNECGRYSILIDGNKIIDIAHTDLSVPGQVSGKFQRWMEKYSDAEIVDCKYKIIMPAAVNSCSKSEGIYIKYLLRNRHYENVKGDLYTDFIFNYIYQELQTEEMKNDLKNIYRSSFAKQLKSGTVLMNEFSLRKDANHINPILGALELTGQKASVCYPIKQDNATIDSYKKLDPAYYLTDESQLTFYDISSLAQLKNTCVKKLFLEVSTNKEVTGKFKSIFNKPIIKLLDEYGLVDENTSLINPLYLSYDELKIIADKKANIIVCPRDLIHFTNRYFPIDDFINNNIPFSIATGWLGEDIFKELRSFRNKYRELNLSSETLLKAITQVPGKLYFSNREPEGIPFIAPNKYADLMFIDMRDVRFQFYPESYDHRHVYDFMLDNLSPNIISDVMVRGEFRVKENILLNADEKELIIESDLTRRKLYKIGRYDEISEREKRRKTVEEIDLSSRDDDEIKLFSDTKAEDGNADKEPKEEFRIKGKIPSLRNKISASQKNLFDETEQHHVIMPDEFQETPMLNLLYSDVNKTKSVDEEINYSKIADVKILKQTVTEKNTDKDKLKNVESKIELPKNVKLKFGDD